MTTSHCPMCIGVGRYYSRKGKAVKWCQYCKGSGAYLNSIDLHQAIDQETRTGMINCTIICNSCHGQPGRIGCSLCNGRGMMAERNYIYIPSASPTPKESQKNDSSVQYDNLLKDPELMKQFEAFLKAQNNKDEVNQ